MRRLNTLVFAGFAMAFSGAHLAPAQTSSVAQLAVQSGNGQVACLCLATPLNDTLDAFQPIVVKATNSSGSAVAGATVTWTVTTGQVTFGPPGNTAGPTTVTSVTGADGTTSQPLNIGLFTNLSSSFLPFLANTIQATSNGKSVQFTETQALPTGNGESDIFANTVMFGTSGLNQVTLAANAGTTLTTPITVFIGGSGTASNGVPGVSIRILNVQSSPVLTCNTTIPGSVPYADPGSVLSDSTGNANCYPKFNGSGSGQFYILIGGLAATDLNSALYLQAAGPYNFSSTPGTPTAINIISGNNQVAAIDVPLSPLVAQLVDANGNPVQGQTMNWSVIPAGAAALPLVQQVTDNNGEVSLTVTLDSLASAGARLTVALASNPSISTTFTESVPSSVTVTGLTKIGGDGQSAQMGNTFANPLVVQVNSTSGAVPNYLVEYQITGPVSIVGGSAATTNSAGQASVTVKAGSTTGSATVVASVGTFTQTFNLTVTPAGPTVTGISIVSGNPQTAVINGAFGAPLVVQVNSASGPVSGVVVNFSGAGPVVLPTAAVTTNSTGQASISVTAGATTGQASVTASISGYSATFNLTVSPSGPSLSASSFLNAASRQVGALSPCSLAIISAPGLTPDGTSDYSLAPIFGRLPKTVHGLSVTFGGVSAPIMSVAMGATNPEVTLQVPCEVTPGSSVPVAVNVNGGGNAPINIPIMTVSPGILQSAMSDGTTRAVVVRSDGSFADVGGTDAYDPNNPARLNEYVRIYATGLGATNPAVGTDSIQDPNADLYGTTANVAGAVQVGIVGFGGLQVISARQAPDLIGVYEVQVAIPSNAPTGNNVQITVGVVPAGSSSSTPAVSSPAAVIPIGQ